MSTERGAVPDVMADGSAAFFTARESAWHALGTVLPDTATYEEALSLGHLDYQVVKSDNPVTFEGPDGKPVVIDGKYATYRTNPVTQATEALGVVGPKYTPTQNVEAFSALIEVARESGAGFETGGTMKEGRLAFLTLMLPQEYLIGGVDAHRLYLFGWNSHDGSTAIRVSATPQRVVCKNTADIAWAKAVGTVNIRHTASGPALAKEAAHALQITTTYMDEMVKAAEALLAQPMTDKQYDGFVDRLFPVKRETARSATLAETRRAGVKGLWKAPSQANIAGTRWAAFNTVTEYLDWFAPVKGAKTKGADVMRATRTLTGGTAATKRRAYALLTK